MRAFARSSVAAWTSNAGVLHALLCHQSRGRQLLEPAQRRTGPLKGDAGSFRGILGLAQRHTLDRAFGTRQPCTRIGRFPSEPLDGMLRPLDRRRALEDVAPGAFDVEVEAIARPAFRCGRRAQSAAPG